MRNFKKLLLSFFVLTIHQVPGQSVITVRKPVDSDSSFYHLARIGPNEYWAGGEYGILKKIDTLGQVWNIQVPPDRFSILKIEKIYNYVFVATDHGVVYRYNLNTGTCLRKLFKGFENRCFYDFMGLPDGSILFCGGTSGISTGEKRIPNGFIFRTDTSLCEPEILWKRKWKFVWSLASGNDRQINAATFNGLNTRIITSTDNHHWKKNQRIKGLVHELVFHYNELWYCGTPSIKFARRGLLGFKNGRQQFRKTGDEGCYWSMDRVNNDVYYVCQNGGLFCLNPDTRETSEIPIPDALCLYDIEKINRYKLMLVGHGGGTYIVNIK